MGYAAVDLLVSVKELRLVEAMGYSQVVWMAEVSASSYSVDLMVNVMVVSKEKS